MLIPVEVPLGYCFNPTDEQLVYYLRTKVGGVPTLVSPPMLKAIQEKELYGDRAPSEMFPISASSASDDHEFYCYTLIKNKFDNGTGARKDRIVSGKGTWKGTQSPKKIYHPQHKSLVIGYRRVLNFIPPPAASSSSTTANKKYNRNSWIMHEYGLDSYPSSDAAQFWVLCRIKYTAAPAPPPAVGCAVKMRAKKRCRTEDQPLHFPTMSTDQHRLPLQACLTISASTPPDCTNQPSPTSHYCFDPPPTILNAFTTLDQPQGSMQHYPADFRFLDGPLISQRQWDGLEFAHCTTSMLLSDDDQALPPTVLNATTTLDQAQGSMQHYPADLRFLHGPLLSQQQWDNTGFAHCTTSMLPSDDDQALPPTMLNATTTLDQAQGSMQHYPADLRFLDDPLLSQQQWDDIVCRESVSEPQDDQFPLPPGITFSMLLPTSDQGSLPSAKDLSNAFYTINDHQPSSSHSEPQSSMSYSDMLSEINSCQMDDDSGLDDFCKYLELPDDIASEIGLVLD